MKILSIETSCDDTAISIIEAKNNLEKASFEVLSNATNSQINIHAEFGGVFPMMAKKEHIKQLPILLDKVLKIINLQDSKKPVDAVAVTYGPGLEPSLWSGIVFAKELSKKWNVPLIPVNHMEGHILSVFGKNKSEFKIPKIKLPVLSLLVSGGHTELILSKKWMKYEILGETLDDAAGEAYDKVARMMDLSYPGGPKISKLAEKERKSKNTDKNEMIKLPRPMMYSKNLDFSFSGLKTAVLYLIRKIGKLDEKTKSQIALEFENSVIETLIHKTKKAKEKYNAKTIIVAGGVACNKHLQRMMKKSFDKNVSLFFPEKELTGDNSIMIGIAGYLQFLKKNRKIGKNINLKAKGNLRFNQK